MKSTQHSSKPLNQQEPKSNDQSPKSDPTLVGDEPIRQIFAEHIPVSDEPKDLPKANPQPIAKPNQKKLDSPQTTKIQQTFEPLSEEPELPPERCQHMKFFDCDKPVSRILFECWHCQQGILSEFTGSPVMGEFKGRPSIIQVKVKCPNCEQTAIRLSTGKIISTTAIPSPWDNVE